MHLIRARRVRYPGAHVPSVRASDAYNVPEHGHDDRVDDAWECLTFAWRRASQERLPLLTLSQPLPFLIHHHFLLPRHISCIALEQVTSSFLQ